MNSKLTRIHKTAAIAGMLLIFSFLGLTVATELNGEVRGMQTAKSFILFLVPVLVVCLAAAGITGRILTKATGGLYGRKLKRTKLVAVTGIFVLAPLAYILNGLAQQESFGPLFWSLQAVEILGGLFNLTLLAKNAADGLKLRQKHTAGRGTVAATVLLGFSLFFGQPAVEAGRTKTCVAYKAKKTVAFITDTDVTGTNCRVSLQTAVKGELLTVKVTIPTKHFESGNDHRDESVVEILGTTAGYEGRLAVSDLIKDNFYMRGVLTIKGKQTPLAFQVTRDGGRLQGRADTTFKALGLAPPNVGPGGLVAEVHQALGLEFTAPVPRSNAL